MFQRIVKPFFNYQLPYLVGIVSLLAVTACGGGGGGGAGSTSSSSFGARVVVTGLESPAIDLFVDSSTELKQRYTFGSDRSFANVGGGDHVLLATVARTPARPLFNDSFVFASQGQVTLISHRTGANGGITLTPVISQIPQDRNRDASYVRFLHGLSGASSATFTAAGQIVSVPFASMSEYVEFSGTELLTSVVRTSDGKSYGSLLTTLTPGGLYTVVLGGEDLIHAKLWVLNG